MCGRVMSVAHGMVSVGRSPIVALHSLYSFTTGNSLYFSVQTDSVHPPSLPPLPLAHPIVSLNILLSREIQLLCSKWGIYYILFL